MSKYDRNRNLLLLVFFIALALLCLFAPGCLTATLPPASVPAPAPVPEPPQQPAPPTVLPIHNDNGYFADSEGKRWYWKFATSFQLLKYELEGTPYDQLLDQYVSAGINGVRVFGMCHNLFDLVPSHYSDYYGGVDRLLTRLAARGLYLELVVFVDAQLVPPYNTTAFQQGHWDGFKRFAGRPNLFLELVNENSHAGNTIDVQAFPFINGIMCSHGSNQTDEHPVEPLWNYTTYHVRRVNAGLGKAIGQYDSLEFEANIHDRPFIPDEGEKWVDARYAELAGMRARNSGGGTFHSQSGVTSQLWNGAELAAAQAFFGAMK